MSLKLIFHVSDFHNLKIVNKIFFFIFEGGLMFLFSGYCLSKEKSYSDNYAQGKNPDAMVGSGDGDTDFIEIVAGFLMEIYHPWICS